MLVYFFCLFFTLLSLSLSLFSLFNLTEREVKVINTKEEMENKHCGLNEGRVAVRQKRVAVTF